MSLNEPRMELTTERLRLRPWQEADAADLYEYARDPRVGPAADWLPHRSVAESLEIIRTVFAQEEVYALELRATGRVVGSVGLLLGAESHLALPADEAEAGYWIGVPFWGQGFVPEALAALLGHAFHTLGLSAVWCCSFADNGSSMRVQQKCGFRYMRHESAAPDKPQGRTRAVSITRLTRAEARRGRLSLRPAGEADIPLIRTLADVAFPATYRDLLTPGQLRYMMEWMYAPEALLRELRAGFAWFIACCDGEPCGYLSLERQEDDLFHLQKIYVLPRFQGCGVGEFLFRHAVGYVRSVHPGPCRMELNVNRHNRALSFYERMGMRKLRAGDFPIGDGYFMNDFIMGLDIP